MNLSPESAIYRVGIHDGPSPSCHKLGEIHQVKPVECPKTHVRDEKVDRALLKDGTGNGKVRHALDVGHIRNCLLKV